MLIFIQHHQHAICNKSAIQKNMVNMSKNTNYTLADPGAHPNGRGPMIVIPQTLFFSHFFLRSRLFPGSATDVSKHTRVRMPFVISFVRKK